MSILFGVCQAEGRVVAEGRLKELGRATERYAQDGTFICARGRIGMGFQPYRTHRRSNLLNQRCLTCQIERSGNQQPTVNFSLSFETSYDREIRKFKHSCETQKFLL